MSIIILKLSSNSLKIIIFAIKFREKQIFWMISIRLNTSVKQFTYINFYEICKQLFTCVNRWFAKSIAYKRKKCFSGESNQSHISSYNMSLSQLLHMNSFTFMTIHKLYRAIQLSTWYVYHSKYINKYI